MTTQTDGRVTRTASRTVTSDGGYVEAAQESLSSVEYTVDSKGAVKPSVKAYAASVADAEAQAADALKKALARIKSGEFN